MSDHKRHCYFENYRFDNRFLFKKPSSALLEKKSKTNRNKFAIQFGTLTSVNRIIIITKAEWHQQHTNSQDR